MIIYIYGYVMYATHAIYATYAIYALYIYIIIYIYICSTNNMWVPRGYDTTPSISVSN